MPQMRSAARAHSYHHASGDKIRVYGGVQLLATIPGVGVMSASAIAATVTDPGMFDSGRDFAAWLGMTPRQNSSGGKERLGGVSKRGDKYIRRLLVGGALAVIRHARGKATAEGEWL